MSSCTKSQVHQAVAQWAGVPVTEVSESTKLDGLGGKSWPQDAPSLISQIQELCNCFISKDVYEEFETVEDIDDFVGAK